MTKVVSTIKTVIDKVPCGYSQCEGDGAVRVSKESPEGRQLQYRTVIVPLSHDHEFRGN